MSALGKASWACLWRDFNCLQEVCLGSWSLLLIPMERTTIFIAGFGTVFSQILRKWYILAPG